MPDFRSEGLEQRERAYTAPAESDRASSFQFRSSLTPCEPEPVPESEHSRRWAVGIAVVLTVILVCVILAAALFFIRFRITVRRENGSLDLNIVRRGAAAVVPAEESRELDAAGAQPGGQERQTYRWNGATLEMEPPQMNGQSWSGIYRERCGCIASVTARNGDGNTVMGTGVVMTSDGFLIVSSHVVLYAETITVQINGREYPADLIGLDNSSDLAVIRIEASDLTPAVFGQSELAQPGDEIAVMGVSLTGAPGIYPGGLTAKAEDYSYRGFSMDLFELYLDLGSQCSGAALLNSSGQVIGIVDTEIAEQFRESRSACFAIPIHAAKDIIDKLLEYGYVPGRPASGLTVAEIPAAYAAYYKYPSCIYVAAVRESSTAYEAGVRKGDLIVSANGVKIQSVDQLYAVINGMEAGDEMTLELFREGETGYITFPLMEAARLAD
jgi:serine protease Do